MAKKPKTRPATEAELAALNFEPWQGPIDYEKLPPMRSLSSTGWAILPPAAWPS
jgi:hypothetical protein